MAEETQINKPSLPADYVSIAVLRERWLERQRIKKQQEEEEAKRKEMRGEERSVDEKEDIVGKGKSGENGYDYVEGVKNDVGGFRGRKVGRFGGGGGYGGDRRRFGGRRERIEVGGEAVEGYREDRRRFGGRKERIEVGGNVVEGYRGDRRRFGGGFGAGKGNVVEGEGLEGFGDMGISEGEDFGGDYREFGRGFGVGKGNVVEGEGLEGFEDMGISEGKDFEGDYREFGRGLGVGKGKNEVEMRNVVGGLKGSGNRRVKEVVDFGDLEIGGGRRGRGEVGGSRERGGFGKGGNGDVKRYVVDVREGTVVDVRLLEDLGEMRGIEEVEIGGEFSGLIGTRVNEEAEIAEKFRDLLRNGSRRGSGKYGRDRGKFKEVLGVGKGENVVEKKRNVVGVRVGSEAVKGNVGDVREENVADGKMLEAGKDYDDRIINEVVDVGKKFGDLKINGGGRRGKFRYGGGVRRKEKERISAAVREENEAVKSTEVAVNRENEVEKRNFVDVKGKNDVEKQIPVDVSDKIEAKQNLVDVNMAESSKGFGHWRGNEAIGGKFGGWSNNWRKGNGKYGSGRERFGSWRNKQEETGMMWVKKTDVEADTQAQA
ncbi:uncharacterized protein LOC141706936 [Apium graveolens]|uniref:uncharacterized protein LOC141706936 n=1 Tax=Apium graveolens TaxID=4045 RepID=UPI003D7ACBEC